jgi:hypothetical protein
VRKRYDTKQQSEEVLFGGGAGSDLLCDARAEERATARWIASGRKEIGRTEAGCVG